MTLWKVVANEFYAVVCNQMAWMTTCAFESQMMCLNVNFKSQKRKVLLIMEKYVTRSLDQYVNF